jgi:hypothetical protein
MKLLTFDDLRQRGWPYSKVHTWRLIKAGKFVQPRKFGFGQNGKNVWPEDEYEAALNVLLGKAETP